MSRHEDRLDFDDYDDTPGKSWDDFDARLKNYAAGKTDDRGWSLADHYSKVDEGSINGPAVCGHLGPSHPVLPLPQFAPLLLSPPLPSLCVPNLVTSYPQLESWAPDPG